MWGNKKTKSLHLCNEKNDDERESPKWRGFPRQHMRRYHKGLERPQVCWESKSKKRGIKYQGPWPTRSVVIGRLSRNLKVCFVFLLDSECVPADGQKHSLATGLPAFSFQFWRGKRKCQTEKRQILYHLFVEPGQYMASRDGRVEGCVFIFSRENSQTASCCEQPSSAECWIGTKNIPHIQGQRKSHNKTVGGANSHLESNPSQ